MRQKLQENFTIGLKDIKKLSLQESTSIIEKDGQTYSCRGAYEIPVWRLDKKNLNGRTYTLPLGEKLVKEAPVTLGLANHPKEDADVTNTFAVEKNPHIREGILYVDAYFVGENGQLANEIIEAGGQIGLSSSAYGELDSNGVIVLEGFEIERYADWVDSPSYEVYAGKPNEIKSEKTEKTVDNKDKENLEEETTKKGKNMSDNKKLTIEEKNLKLGVKQLFKTADGIEDLREKLGIYHEILEYCEGFEEFANDYIEEANTKIKEINESLFEAVKVAKEIDSLKTSTKETTESITKELEESKKTIDLLEKKYDKAKEMLDDLKLREMKVTEMYKIAVAEKNTMVSAKEYKELYEYVETQQDEVNRLRKELVGVVKERNSLKEQIEELSERPVVFVGKETPREETSIEESVEEKEEKETPIEEEVESNFRHPSVEYYYEDLKSANPNVVRIKEKLMECKTVFEAQKMYLRLRDLLDDEPVEKQEENVKKITVHDIPLKIKKGWN